MQTLSKMSLEGYLERLERSIKVTLTLGTKLNSE